MGTECGEVKAAAEFCPCDLVVEGMECAQVFDPCCCIPLVTQRLHLRPGCAVDEKLRRCGGGNGEEEVVAFARPCGAFFQFLGGKGGGNCILQGGAVRLRQVDQLRGGQFFCCVGCKGQ